MQGFFEIFLPRLLNGSDKTRRGKDQLCFANAIRGE